MFTITQKEFEIRYKIQDYLGFGQVHQDKYSATNLINLLTIIEKFEGLEFVSQAKFHDFTVWTKAVNAIVAKQHLKPDTYWELRRLQETMHVYEHRCDS